MSNKKIYQDKICLVCGEVFTRSKSFSTKQWKDAKYCSKKCWNVRGKIITKKCEWCGKEFSLPAHLMRLGKTREKRTCSTECRYSLITGNRSYMWKGEKARYNMRFRDALSNTYMYKRWRKAVKKTHNDTCVNCGEKKEGMHVHHIYPLAQIIKDENWTYDRYVELYNSPDSKLWDVSNGVTLCGDCHYSLISYALQSKGFHPSK
jgi:hypothetical protein